MRIYWVARYTIFLGGQEIISGTFKSIEKKILKKILHK